MFTAAAALAVSCHNHSAEEHAAAEAGHHDEPGIIELHDHVTEHFDFALDTLAPGDFHAVVRASGMVVRASADNGIVAAPAAGTVTFAPGMSVGRDIAKGSVVATINTTAVAGGDANAAARARLEAAEAELARIEALAADKLATRAELLAARAELASARAAYSPHASAGRAVAPIAGTLSSVLVAEGAYVNVGDPIATVSKGAGTLLRVDLPSRYFKEAKTIGDMVADFPSGVKFKVSARGGRRLSGTPAGAPDAGGAYIPLYFSVSDADAATGAPFTAHLIGAAEQGVLTVPESALSEQQGQFFIYRQEKPEHYEKVPVTVLATDGERARISGVPAGTVYVAKGVTAVRLAETSSAAPEGHSHNH